MSRLPSGWAETQLGSLIERVEAGLNVKCEERPPQGKERGLVKISAVTWGRFNEEQSKTLPADITVSANAQIQTGDLLFSRANTIELVGATVLVEEIEKHLYLSDKVLRLVVPAESKRWINYAMKTAVVRKAIQDASSGNQLSMRNISQEKLRQIPIPLAPLPEQKRIADKLDSLLTRVDACRDRLDRLPALLKRFRQSILTAATSGRLTEDWRRQHSNNSKAMASTNDMLAKLAEEQTAAKSGGRAGKIEPLLTDLPDAINLPVGWAVTGFDALAAPERNALKAGPFGSALKKHMYVQDGYKIYGQEQVISGDEDFGDYFIDKEKFQELSSCAVKPGDILISLVGTIGRILILSNQAMPGIINPRLVKLSLHSSISRQYIALYLGSPTAQNFFAKQSHGGTMDILNLGILRELPILLPPPTEQTEIVRRVEILFAFADRLEARLATARRQVGQLTPALLAKAFRGELVAQDPADESAAELLKRLAAQREAAPKTRRGRASKA